MVLTTKKIKIKVEIKRLFIFSRRVIRFLILLHMVVVALHEYQRRWRADAHRTRMHAPPSAPEPRCILEDNDIVVRLGDNIIDSINSVNIDDESFLSASFLSIDVQGRLTACRTYYRTTLRKRV